MVQTLRRADQPLLSVTDAVEPLLDAAEPTVGRAGSLLVNIPALIALQRSHLGQLCGDAEATPALASQALAGSADESLHG